MFKDTLLSLYMQECALNDEKTYWEVQDTLFGEMLDNKVRIKMLKAENQIHEGHYNDEEIMAEAKRRYMEDCEAELNK